jgi:hypothetical protein
MIIKILITLFGLSCAILLAILSHALMQDIVDPVTKRRVRDNQARTYGFIGYLVSSSIIFGLYHYLF